jgi:hypothetical protein
MEFVATLATGPDQVRGLQHSKMLADRLPGQPQTVLGRQAPADFEQGLTTAIRQLVEDAPSRGVGQRLEDIVRHNHTIGK